MAKQLSRFRSGCKNCVLGIAWGSIPGESNHGAARAARALRETDLNARERLPERPYKVPGQVKSGESHKGRSAFPSKLVLVSLGFLVD